MRSNGFKKSLCAFLQKDQGVELGWQFFSEHAMVKLFFLMEIRTGA
jgi:hypothetical protein